MKDLTNLRISLRTAGCQKRRIQGIQILLVFLRHCLNHLDTWVSDRQVDDPVSPMCRSLTLQSVEHSERQPFHFARQHPKWTYEDGFLLAQQVLPAFSQLTVLVLVEPTPFCRKFFSVSDTA